jgi:hypothetical protein
MREWIDVENGVTEKTVYDPLTNLLHVTRSVDVEGNLDYSKALAKDEDVTRNGIKNEFWHYAHIPNVILEKWALEGVNINDPKELVKKVNSPDYAYFKTTSKYHR